MTGPWRHHQRCHRWDQLFSRYGTPAGGRRSARFMA